MAMANVVTIAAYIGGSIGSGWSAWSKGRWPPGAACYIRQMNRVNSGSGSALLRWQHHQYCHGYYYYYYYYRRIPYHFEPWCCQSAARCDVRCREFDAFQLGLHCKSC